MAGEGFGSSGKMTPTDWMSLGGALNALEARIATLEEIVLHGAPAGEEAAAQDDGMPNPDDVIPGLGMSIRDLMSQFGPKLGFAPPAAPSSTPPSSPPSSGGKTPP